MEQNVYQLIQQVNKKIPETWYESEEHKAGIAASLSVILIVCEIIAVLNQSDGLLTASIISGLFYIFSVALDFFSTYRGLAQNSLIPDETMDKYPVQLIEQNPDLYGISDPHEVMRKSWTKEQIVVLILGFVPPVGIGIGSIRLLDGVSNLREFRRFKSGLSLVNLRH